MAHFLVEQLKFARRELQRCLEGMTEVDALRRLGPMNSIGWIVGHLASQENYIWVNTGQQIEIWPDLINQVGYGKPATTPPLGEMWRAWAEITAAADQYLDHLTDEKLSDYLKFDENMAHENVGTMLMRNIYHYWFHIGEAHAIRQGMGHQDLPDFVGRFEDAVY